MGGVEAGSERGDAAAFPRGIPAFENDHRRDTVLPADAFEIIEPPLESGEDTIVLGPGERSLKVEVF